MNSMPEEHVYICADGRALWRVMDNLYGSITEDNADEYLVDNLHLNVKGRKLIAKRFEYFLNYYSKDYASQEK